MTKSASSESGKLKWQALVFICVLTSCHLAESENGMNDLPLENCLTDDIDLLIIEETSRPKYIRDKIRFKYTDLLGVFCNDDDVAKNRIKLTFATYSENVTVHRNFNEAFFYYEHEGSLISSYIPEFIPDETVNTSAALEFISGGFSPELGSRPDAQHIAILVASSIPTIDRDLAREVASSLTEQSDITVILIHSIEDIEEHDELFPTSIAIKVPDISYFAPSFYNMLCRPCQPFWFSIPERTGQQSCYRFYFRDPPYDRSLKCQNMKLAEIESYEEMIAIEKEFFNYASQRISDNDKDLSFHVGLRRQTNSLRKRFQWSNGRPLTYRNRNQDESGDLQDACTVWNFPKMNPTVQGLGADPVYIPSEDKLYSVEELTNSSHVMPSTQEDEIKLSYEFWREINRPGFRDASCQETTSAELCMEKIKVGTITQRSFHASVPSRQSVDEALAKGQFVVIEENSANSHTGNVSLTGHSKVVSLSRILPTLMTRKSNIRLYTNMSDPSQVLTKESLKRVPLFDCRPESGVEFIAYSHVCDWRTDCSTGRDETICSSTPCRGQWSCASGQCVPREAWCDLYPDCYDGSDESNCQDVCKHFSCSSGRCIPKSWQNDGYPDCATDLNPAETDVIRLDESLDNPEFGTCIFMCNRTECVTRLMIMDEKTDCKGPEGYLDNILKTLPNTYCTTENDDVPGVENTWAPVCVYIKDGYGAIIGCTNLGHLQNCQNVSCPVGYFKCPESYCIPLHYVRNQIEDCPFGEDEDIQEIVENSSFECVSTIDDTAPVLLNPSLVCDGHMHCPSGDDEADCGVSCEDGFLCAGGAVLVTDPIIANTTPHLSFIDPQVKYLDIAGLFFPDFFSSFPEDHLRNVIWLNVSGCEITNIKMTMMASMSVSTNRFGEDKESQSVTNYATEDFQLVRVLDLSHNKLDPITKEAAAIGAMENLQHLNLSHNPNLEISKQGFQRTASHILTLDLSYTAVSELTNDVMDMFTSLVSLSLEGTHLSRLSRALPQTLIFLNLQFTPLIFIESDAFNGLTDIQELLAPSYKVCCPQNRGPDIPAYACFARDDVISSCDDLIKEPIQRVLLWLFGAASLLGNVIVLLYRVTWDRALLKKGYGIFVLNLSSSDLLMGVYLLIIAYADLTYRGTYVTNEDGWRHSEMCRLAGFLSTWSCESSAMFIFLITLDRYLVIRFPFGHVRVSVVGYILTSVFAWVCGLVLATIPLLPQFTHWSVYSSNGMCLGLPLTGDKAPGWQFSITVFVGVNFLLFLLIALGQIAIFKTMSSNRMAADDAMSKFQTLRRQQDIAVAQQLSLVVISDFLCWFPIGTLGFMAWSGTVITPDVYAWFAVMVLPINSAINPVLYTVPALKKTLGNFILTFWDKKSSKQDKDKHGDATYEKQLSALITTLKFARTFLNTKDLVSSRHQAFQEKYPVLQNELDEVSIALHLASKDLSRIEDESADLDQSESMTLE